MGITAREWMGVVTVAAAVAVALWTVRRAVLRREQAAVRRLEQTEHQLQRVRETLLEFVRLNARLQRIQAGLVDFAGAAGNEGVLDALASHAARSDGASQVVLVTVDTRRERFVAVRFDATRVAEGGFDDESVVARVVGSQATVHGGADDAPSWFPSDAATWVALPVERGGTIHSILVVAFSRELPEHDPEIGTLSELARQAGAALERTLVVEALEESQITMQRLSRHVIETEERERRHISRELHDVLGGWLTSLRLGLAGLVADVNEGKPVTVRRLRDCESTVETMLGSVRSLAVELRPDLLDEEGLVPAVRWHLERTGSRAGLATEFVDRTHGRRASRAIEFTAFRIVQEALNNVVRHAQASNVRIVIECPDHELIVEVVDDGIGFDVDRIPDETLGLKSMRERVEIVGGLAVVESAPLRGGTTVRARLPFEPPRGLRANAARA